MIYIIKRASGYHDLSPCEEAIKRPFENWHTRGITEDSYNERFSLKQGTWRSIGKNHTITNEGYITRQLNDEMLWSIEVNSLEDGFDNVKHKNMKYCEDAYLFAKEISDILFGN